METLKKEYLCLKIVHTNNVQKLHNVQKKIGRLKKDSTRLQVVANELIGENMINGVKLKIYKKRITCKEEFSPTIFRTKVDYTMKCINWLRNKQCKINLSTMCTDDIIILCHTKYHNSLLKNFSFFGLF